jgi:hypothetical protein
VTTTKLTTRAVLLVCAAAMAPVFLAAPSFGKDIRSHHRRVIHHYYSANRDYSGYLDPTSGHYDPEFQRNRENFGFSGRDPSYPGGVDPSIHPGRAF